MSGKPGSECWSSLFPALELWAPVVLCFLVGKVGVVTVVTYQLQGLDEFIQGQPELGTQSNMKDEGQRGSQTLT